MTPIDFIKIKYPGEFKETSATNLFNLKEVENLMKDYAKQILEEYTNRIVENVYGNTFDHDLYIRDYFGTENSVDIDMSEGSPLQYGCSVKIDKESITSQLPLILKELGI